MDVEAENTSRYIGEKVTTNTNELKGGTLSANFMINNKAVIDFGNLRSYVKSKQNTI